MSAPIVGPGAQRAKLREVAWAKFRVRLYAGCPTSSEDSRQVDRRRIFLHEKAKRRRETRDAAKAAVLANRVKHTAEAKP